MWEYCLPEITFATKISIEFSDDLLKDVGSNKKMNNKNITKFFLLILALVLLSGVSVMVSASAEKTTTPEIFSQNVKYTDRFCLMYAIKADTVSGGSVTLNVYGSEPENGSDPIRSYTVNSVTSSAESGAAHDAYIVTTDGIAAMALNRKFYVQAVDGDGNKSAVKAYSVVDYLYTRLADEDGVANTETQNDLYKSVISFGTCAQRQFLTADELASTTLISDYCYITASNCTINGTTAAILPQGKTFYVDTNDIPSDLTVTTYDTYDISGIPTVSAASSNDIVISNSYRAHIKADPIKTYREGTETFEGYDLGTNAIGSSSSANFVKANAWAFYKSTLQTVYTDIVYGKESNVLKITQTQSANFAFGVNCGSVAAESATAFEFSLDFKFDSSAVNQSAIDSSTDALKYPCYLIKLVCGSSDVKATFRLADKDGKLYIDRDNTNADYVLDTDIPVNEWNNIKLVVRTEKDGDTVAATYVDVYLNNYTASPDRSMILDQTCELASITAVHFTPMSGNHNGGTVYMDNIFSGFIND